MSEGRRKRLRGSLDRLRERAELADAAQFDAEYARIAAQVAEQRRARRLTQAELAELCGTTQSAIARLEAGGRPPRLDTLLRVAEALDCRLEVRLRPRTVSRPSRGDPT